MSVLRLGVYRLPAPEVAVIRTIVQLYACDLSFPWTMVNAPPYDALLVDESATASERAECARMSGVVLALTRMHSGSAPHTLERPIRADRLQQWLKSTERALQAVRPARSILEERAAPKVEVSDSVRFTLRRWPSALLLRNDPDKVRMASLLARRTLSALELAELGEIPLPRCVMFLQTLRSAGMLEQHVAPPAARAYVESPAARAYAESPRVQRPSAPAGGEFMRGLIGGIRRRLGLGAAS
ncbi:hypothetical protein M2282_003081 [Variovorax boronicumulans]|uniref:hypothetical protein n=1 Tax=Variovorax boronicumulans TaxID=436515 RepID=UPI002475781E|nr:hypothetical protein [Variovorax boronicumulans]MDH6167930.1 hypothetical protein [Variovorax boronicumulans]